MAAINHTKVTSIADDGSSDVGAGEWNDDHTITGDVVPDTDTAYDLGSSSKTWVEGYFENVVFPATQVPSGGANTLDDYEESAVGSGWTPTLGFDTAGNESIILSTADGTYEKFGRIVRAQFAIISSTFTHSTASGGLRLGGLPFTASTWNARGAVTAEGWTLASVSALTYGLKGGTTYGYIYASRTATTVATMGTGEWPTAGTVKITGTVVYHI